MAAEIAPAAPASAGLRRWIPAASMLLVSLVSYIDRNTLALLAPTLLADLHLSAEQYGYAISAFSVAYMIGNPAWGWALDRYGLRRGMTASVLTWTIASVSHVFVRGLAGLAMARAALGFGEGAAFPGGLRAVVQTLPPASQSRGIAIAYSGGSLGAIVTPIVITPVAALWGWRAAFWFTGVLGAAWLVLWRALSRTPALQHAGADSGARTAANDDRPRPRAGDRDIWAYMFLYALGALPLAFILYGASIYLHQAVGLSQVQIGSVLWIPPVGWEIGYFFWGFVIDRTLAHESGGSRRRWWLMLAATLLSVPVALTPLVSGAAATLALLFVATFAAGGFIMLAVAFATRVYSSASSALLSGLGSAAWSGLVALVMPSFGRLLDLHRYGLAFAIVAACPVAGFAIWSALRRG
jgi:ACS family hexuronate transporter-like MFS transporter